MFKSFWPWSGSLMVRMIDSNKIDKHAHESWLFNRFLTSVLMQKYRQALGPNSMLENPSERTQAYLFLESRLWVEKGLSDWHFGWMRRHGRTASCQQWCIRKCQTQSVIPSVSHETWRMKKDELLRSSLLVGRASTVTSNRWRSAPAIGLPSSPNNWIGCINLRGRRPPPDWICERSERRLREFQIWGLVVRQGVVAKLL